VVVAGAAAIVDVGVVWGSSVMNEGFWRGLLRRRRVLAYRCRLRRVIVGNERKSTAAARSEVVSSEVREQRGKWMDGEASLSRCKD